MTVSSTTGSDSDNNSEDFNLQEKLIEESKNLLNKNKLKNKNGTQSTKSPKVQSNKYISDSSDDSSIEEEIKESINEANKKTNVNELMLQAKLRYQEQLKKIFASKYNAEGSDDSDLSSEEEQESPALELESIKTLKQIPNNKEDVKLKTFNLSTRKGFLQKNNLDDLVNNKEQNASVSKPLKGILKKEPESNNSDDDNILPLNQEKFNKLTKDVSSMDASFSNALSSTQIQRSHSESEFDSDSPRSKFKEPVKSKKISLANGTKLKNKNRFSLIKKPDSSSDSNNDSKHSDILAKGKPRKSSSFKSETSSLSRVTATEFFVKEKSENQYESDTDSDKMKNDDELDEGKEQKSINSKTESLLDSSESENENQKIKFNFNKKFNEETKNQSQSSDNDSDSESNSSKIWTTKSDEDSDNSENKKNTQTIKKINKSLSMNEDSESEIEKPKAEIRTKSKKMLTPGSSKKKTSDKDSDVENEKSKVTVINKNISTKFIINRESDDDSEEEIEKLKSRNQNKMENISESDSEQPESELNQIKEQLKSDKNDTDSSAEENQRKVLVKTVQNESKNKSLNKLLFKKFVAVDSLDESNVTDNKKMKQKQINVEVKRKAREELSESSSSKEDVVIKNQMSPINLKEFEISNPNLQIVNTGTSLFLEDLKRNEEVWLMQCPKSLPPKNLIGQQLDFNKNKTKMKIDGVRYEYKTQQNEENLKVCLIASESRNSQDLLAKLVKPAGNVIIHQVLKSKTAKIKIMKKMKVKPPPDLKLRHPIFGKDFEQKIQIGEDIRNLLLEAEIARRKANKKADKKRNQKLIDIKKKKEENMKQDNINKNEIIFQLLNQTKNDFISESNNTKNKKRKLSISENDMSANKKIKTEKKIKSSSFSNADEVLDKSVKKLNKSSEKLNKSFDKKEHNSLSEYSDLKESIEKLNKSGKKKKITKEKNYFVNDNSIKELNESLKKNSLIESNNLDKSPEKKKNKKIKEKLSELAELSILEKRNREINKFPEKKKQKNLETDLNKQRDNINKSINKEEMMNEKKKKKSLELSTNTESPNKKQKNIDSLLFEEVMKEKKKKKKKEKQSVSFDRKIEIDNLLNSIKRNVKKEKKNKKRQMEGSANEETSHKKSKSTLFDYI